MKSEKHARKTSMKDKGAYWGNFYIPIEYNQNSSSNYDVINHELAHALLSESTAHGFAYTELSALSSENYTNSRLMEVLKVLHDASERTEECFAILFPLLNLYENNKQLQVAYNELRQTEYYYRYQIKQFDNIVLSEVTINEKIELIKAILFAAMNTNILNMECDWLSSENVYQELKRNAILINPDRRLKVLLRWVNCNISDPIVFGQTEAQLLKEVLNQEIPSGDMYEHFRNAIISFADENNLLHGYTEKTNSDSEEESIDDRVYFHLDDSIYTSYIVDIPCLELLRCDAVLFFPLGRLEYLIFTNCQRKEKYKLILPRGSFSEQFLNQFSGIIVAYLDDFEFLEMKLTTLHNKKILFKSACSFNQLIKELDKRDIVISSVGIFEYDSAIGSPYFLDSRGIYYCGAPRRLDYLLNYKSNQLQFISPKTPVMHTAITAAEIQVIYSSDIAIDTDKNPNIAIFNGSLDDKIYSKDTGIDSHEICGYYFGIFEQTIMLHNWKDAHSLFNFMLNLLNSNEDRISALHNIENIVVKCKRTMLVDLKKDQHIKQAFIDLFSMIIQCNKQFKVSLEDACITLTNLTNLYLECNDLDEAYQYATIGLNIKRSIYKEDALEIGKAYYLLGLVLIHLDVKEAILNFNIAKKIALKNDDTEIVSVIQHIIQQIT